MGGAWATTRRALNLQRAAQAVVERHGGALPTDPKALRSLPGVGEYTANALACFAPGAAGGGGRHQRAPGAGARLPLALDADGPRGGGDGGARPARGQGVGVEPGR